MAVSDHMRYMNLKKSKLAEQNLDQRFLLEDAKTSTIFNDVSVYITGFTTPSSANLKEMILHNGGNVQMFFSKRNVTHIVASNLPDFKIHLWKNDIIVKPDWIVDSVKARCCLPVANYILYRSDRDIKTMINSRDEVCLPKSPKVISATSSNNFINEFYSNSRLHHLSTSASELRQTVSKFQTKFHPWYFPQNKLQNDHTFILHIDIDCFFASISLKSRPHLKGLPICVTHAKPGEKPNSYAEIASCSYEARKFGIKNGMLFGKVITLCPNIITVPYEFEEYHVSSNTFYRLMVEMSPLVEVVSCDEAFVDISETIDTSDLNNVQKFVQNFRDKVYHAIGCTVSIGGGKNKLIARMATRIAKPNGQHLCKGDNNVIQQFISKQNINMLPGIGHQTCKKFYGKNIETCADVLLLSKQHLIELLGPKTGETVFHYCRGTDTRELLLKYERKSISVEINYGIRVSTIEDLKSFLLNLCKELEKRMKNENLKGHTLLFKIKVRSEGESLNPLKYMGHGICDNFSKSISLTLAINDSVIIHEKIVSLYKSFSINPCDIRGIGIHMGKLIKDDTEEKARQQKEECIYTSIHCEEPNFLGRKDVVEIREIFTTWSKNTEPLQNDVDKVDEYFRDLIKYGNINLVEELLKLFRNLLLDKGEEWIAVFNEILNNMQKEVFEELGGILIIDSL